MLVSFEEKVLATIAVLLLVATVVIGFSQRSVTITGGVEYSCGSGFVHSEQTWKADSVGLQSGRTPTSACPAPVIRYRNLAIVLGVLGILGAVVVIGMGDSSSVSGRARYLPPTPHTQH
jgi:hypothetical protein